MALTENIGTVLIISVLGIASVLMILITVEKKLKFKEKLTRKDKNKLYVLEVKQIDKSKPEEALKSVDAIAKRFFVESFKIKNFSGYAELKELFKKKNNTKAIEFCELMDKLLYSKEKQNNQTPKLIHFLIGIIRSNKILEKEIKSKNPNLRKMKIFRVREKKLKNQEGNSEKK